MFAGSALLSRVVFSLEQAPTQPVQLAAILDMEDPESSAGPSTTPNTAAAAAAAAESPFRPSTPPPPAAPEEPSTPPPVSVEPDIGQDAIAAATATATATATTTFDDRPGELLTDEELRAAYKEIVGKACPAINPSTKKTILKKYNKVLGELMATLGLGAVLEIRPGELLTDEELRAAYKEIVGKACPAINPSTKKTILKKYNKLLAAEFESRGWGPPSGIAGGGGGAGATAAGTRSPRTPSTPKGRAPPMRTATPATGRVLAYTFITCQHTNGHGG